MGAVLVGAPQHILLEVLVGEESGDLRPLVLGSGEIQLIGALGELNDPVEIRNIVGAYFEFRLARGKKSVVIVFIFYLIRLPRDGLPVVPPPVLRLDAGASLEPRIIEQTIDVIDVETGHFREAARNFLEFEQVVVDEGEGVQGDIERGRNPFDILAFRTPVDAGMEEVVGKAELLHLPPRVIVVVLAGDTQQNTAPVELSNQPNQVFVHPQRFILEQDALPQGVVQIENHALDAFGASIPIDATARRHEIQGQEHQPHRVVPFRDEGHLERDPGIGDGLEQAALEPMARVSGIERYGRGERRRQRCRIGVIVVETLADPHGQPEGDWLRLRIEDLDEKQVWPALTVGAAMRAAGDPVEIGSQVFPSAIAGRSAEDRADRVQKGNAEPDQPLFPQQPTDRLHSGIAVGLEPAPGLERDFGAVAAKRAEPLVLVDAVSEPTAIAVGTALIEVAGRIAVGSRTLDAMLAPVQERHPFDVGYGLVRRRGRIGRSRVEPFLVFVELEHGDSS